MRRSVPAAAQIDLVVNSHANGDHCYGNELVADARIIASKHTADQMLTEIAPDQFAELLRLAPAMGATGEYLTRIFGPFKFDGITLTLPKETFEGEMSLHVGDKEVRLIEVGPAHTLGDTLVYIPSDRVVFTADILFIGGHPIAWAGPVSNWIRACDYILSLDVETIVPGHGPITDKDGVREFKNYLNYVFDETRQRYEAGMPSLEAAKTIPMARYASWTDGERIAVTVATIYRELSGDSSDANRITSFAEMAALAHK